MNQAVILQALRTPVGKFMGALKPFTAVDLGVFVVKALLDKTSVPVDQIEEIIMGNVVSAGLGQNPARQESMGRRFSLRRFRRLESSVSRFQSAQLHLQQQATAEFSGTRSSLQLL